MTPSGIIFQGYGYTAALATKFKPVLSVTRQIDGETRGKYLTDDDALSWAEAIKSAIDAHEAAALCKAVYNG